MCSVTKTTPTQVVIGQPTTCSVYYGSNLSYCIGQTCIGQSGAPFLCILANHTFKVFATAPINSCHNMVVWFPTSFGLGHNGCWLSQGSQLPQALRFIFLLCCPLNDCRRAHSFFKISRLFFLSLFCSSLTCLRLFILLLLLMSDNVHPNPGPIFPCAMCAGNVIWWGKSVQCSTCSKWVHLRCS